MMTTGPDPPKAPTDVGRCTSEPRPCYKVPLSSMSRNATSRGVSYYKCTRCSGWVNAKCSIILNAAHYRKKSYRTCDTCCCLPTSMTLAIGGVRCSRLWSTNQLMVDGTKLKLCVLLNFVCSKMFGRGL